MKKYIDELFEVQKNKNFEQFLADELYHHLNEVERSWLVLIGAEEDEWPEYRLLLENISRSLNVAIDFIERTEGPDIVWTLYNEVLNLVDDSLLEENMIDEKDYEQIQYSLASLGICLNVEFLELGLFEEGELTDHLSNQMLSVLNAFGK